MVQKTYYVDSCIWLNLFKKEGDPTKGAPYWKITQEFLEGVIFSENKMHFAFSADEEVHLLPDE